MHSQIAGKRGLRFRYAPEQLTVGSALLPGNLVKKGSRFYLCARSSPVVKVQPGSGRPVLPIQAPAPGDKC